MRQAAFRKRQREAGEKPESKKNAPKRAKTRHEVEQQRQYWTLKQREYRAKKHNQTKRRTKEKDRLYRKQKRGKFKSPNTCLSSSVIASTPLTESAVRKAASRAKLPKSPMKFAATVHYIIKKATPRKQVQLRNSNIHFDQPEAKKKLKFVNKSIQALAEVIRDNITAKKRCLRWLAPCLRKYRLQGTASKLIGFSPTTMTSYAKTGDRKTRSDTVPAEVKEKVNYLFTSPDMSLFCCAE